MGLRFVLEDSQFCLFALPQYVACAGNSGVPWEVLWWSSACGFSEVQFAPVGVFASALHSSLLNKARHLVYKDLTVLQLFQGYISYTPGLDNRGVTIFAGLICQPSMYEFLEQQEGLKSASEG